MNIIKILFKGGASLQKSFSKIKNENPEFLQKRTLKRLLKRAAGTSFGEFYNFNEILGSQDIIRSFSERVPVFDYTSLHEKWWHLTLEGERNICWPGKVKYFALSSGTTGTSSKHIPVTSAMIHSVKRAGMQQLLSLINQYSIPKNFFNKDMLILGGTSTLSHVNKRFEGDLSGILAGKFPLWLNHHYKPGNEIAKETDWDTMIEKIVEDASKWDITTIMGIPSWVQILLERIIAHYKVKNVHEIWPNLMFFVYGGVAFEPYKKGFSKLTGKEMNYINTYLASEGFMAYQNAPLKKELKLVTGNGIFFEFIPFDDKNFSADGEMTAHPEIVQLKDVTEGKNYALLISTCSGAWRYLIGDTIKFTSSKKAEIEITGRTKHFINMACEHLSVDNMNQVIEMASEKFQIYIKEFAVAGIPYKGHFAHKWYIGTNDSIDSTILKKFIDDTLKTLNDDYSYERNTAIKEIFLEVLPPEIFYDWMKKNGKEGGQHKFPRALKGPTLKDWEDFLEKQNVVNA